MRRCGKGEKEKADELLGDFVVDGSLGQKAIEQVTGRTEVPLQFLTFIAKILSIMLGCHIARGYWRRKELILKWMSKNYQEIEPLLPYIRAIIEQTKNDDGMVLDPARVDEILLSEFPVVDGGLEDNDIFH